MACPPVVTGDDDGVAEMNSSLGHLRSFCQPFQTKASSTRIFFPDASVSNHHNTENNQSKTDFGNHFKFTVYCSTAINDVHNIFKWGEFLRSRRRLASNQQLYTL